MTKYISSIDLNSTLLPQNSNPVEMQKAILDLLRKIKSVVPIYGQGGPTQPATFIGQIYVDTDSGSNVYIGTAQGWKSI